jgi:hypothetical protein
LDRSSLDPLKTYFADPSTYFVRESKAKFSKFNFGFIFKCALTKTANYSVAENGFTSKGILPFNKIIVGDHEMYFQLSTHQLKGTSNQKKSQVQHP